MSFVKKVLNAPSAAVYILIVASSPYCRNYTVSIGREIFNFTTSILLQEVLLSGREVLSDN